MCPGHEANGEFAGDSGNLHREWWRTENLRFSLISQVVENQRTNLENKKAERCVRSAKRQKNGGKDRSRTGDTRIFSPLLYQLSYPATHKMVHPVGIEPATFWSVARRSIQLSYGCPSFRLFHLTTRLI